MKVKPFFTIKELMPLVGRTSRQGVKGVMRSFGVPCALIGNKHVYFLSHIKERCPELLASIEEALAHNELEDDNE